jgi:spore maturation protein CgeB
MYRTLRQSRITLNRHARLEVGGTVNRDWCNNMRMYEATGVGTCLLTEWRPRLHELFEPEREIVTYRDDRKCVEKIRYYLAHEEERAAIARAGQERTLREHLYTDRMRELLDIFRRNLGRKRGDSSFLPRKTEITQTTPA